MLEKMGCIVAVASDGLEALHAMDESSKALKARGDSSSEPFHLILMCAFSIVTFITPCRLQGLANAESERPRNHSAAASARLPTADCGSHWLMYSRRTATGSI